MSKRRNKKHRKKKRKVRGGKTTQQQRSDCRKYYGYCCYVCGDLEKPRNKMQVHHIRQRSNGGSNNPENLMLTCNVCHRVIHNARPLKSIDESLWNTIRHLRSLL